MQINMSDVRNKVLAIRQKEMEAHDKGQYDLAESYWNEWTDFLENLYDILMPEDRPETYREFEKFVFVKM